MFFVFGGISIGDLAAVFGIVLAVAALLFVLLKVRLRVSLNLLFAVYCVGLLLAVFLPTASESTEQPVVKEIVWQIDVLRGLKGYVFLLDGLVNTVIFIPLGMYAFYACGNALFAVLLGGNVSALIEFGQLFCRGRVSDINDLVANTIGCAIGVCAVIWLKYLCEDSKYLHFDAVMLQ